MIAGRRAQQRVPLADIDGRSDIGNAGQQKMVFYVEQPRRLIGALHIAADLVEIPALVSEKGAFGDPGMCLTGLLYRGEQRRQIAG